MANVLTITADSTPIYDTWGWSDYWSCDDWMAWHKAMAKKYGDKYADETWANAWLDGLSVGGGGRGKVSGSNFLFDAIPDPSCRTFNFPFRDYINARPIMKSAVFNGVGGFIGGIVSNGIRLGASVGDLAGGAGEGLVSLSKQLRWIIPVVAITALGYVGYRIYSLSKS